MFRLVQHKNFPAIAPLLNSVCCYRSSPGQKIKIIKKLKKTKKRILAIGDGGNDVGMIEEAHIGVGIYGREGKRAVLACDYELLRFKDLVKLLLYHGRLIYTTSAEMSKFVMHRGIIIATMQFSFTSIFFLIDIPLFNGILMFGYTTVFTNLPVIAIVIIFLY